MILPGESLAKYKERGISPHLPPDQPTDMSSAPAEAAASESSAAAPEVSGSLPSSLYAAPESAPALEPPASEAGSEREDWRWQSPRRPPMEPPTPPSRAAIEPQTETEPIEIEEEREELPTPEPEPAAEVHAAANGSDVTEEEMTALSERLAEARHEETTSEAEADDAHGDPELEDEAAMEESESEDFAHDEPTEEEAHEDAEALAAAGGLMEEGVPTESVEHEEDMPQPDSSSAEPATSARISEPQRQRFQRPMRRGGRHRGHQPGRRREHHGGHRPQQQQRRPQLISEMLKAGQEIIVQIAKEPLGKKGARITSHVALPGRHLVYMPTVNHIGVSRRIASAEERSRLRRIVGDAKTPFPGGFIVRTAAEGAAEEDIRSDVEFLGRTWEKIRTQSEPRKAPSLLHRDLNLVERILRDYLSSDYAAIWIDNEEEYGKILEFVGRFQPKLVDRVKLYTKTTPIFEEFGIQQELDKALRPKVWLKSGGYIVINHTEALVAIDVNTGKYVGPRLDAPGRHHRQDQPRSGEGNRAPDSPARPGRHHRPRLHRYGRAAQSRQGDVRAGIRAARRPRSVQGALLQRIRPGGHHPQAHQAGPRARALPAVPVLHRLRHGEIHAHHLLRDSGRSAQDGRSISTPPASRCASIRKSPKRSRRARPRSSKNSSRPPARASSSRPTQRSTGSSTTSTEAANTVPDWN